MTNHKKEAVEYCLNTFNFERVHKVMEQVNWMWATRDGLKIPTIVQLILAAQQRLNDAWDKRINLNSGVVSVNHYLVGLCLSENEQKLKARRL